MKKIKGIGGKSLRKGGGGLRNLAKMQEEFQKKMEEIESKYGEETVEVTAGGGAIRVKMACDYRLVGLEYDKDILEDSEMFNDILMAAINEALQEVERKRKEIMESELGALGLSGLGNLPF
ncbi:MAG: YbaB/EbfC family nucleoid-associated protein [Thermotogaceae bacterium]|nr:YbaB/EbfC family nucleoid-associated protein [Thermotogaceae bacterium]